MLYIFASRFNENETEFIPLFKTSGWYVTSIISLKEN